MRVPLSGLKLDNPAWPLLQALTAYWGITDQNGNAAGTSLIDSLCSTAGLQPSYAGQVIRIMTGPAAGQIRQIGIHALASGTITVAAPFTDETGAVEQIVAGTKFVILSTGGGGGAPPPPPAPPDVSLWFFGVCNPTMAASTVTVVATGLAGLSEDILNNRFYMQILHNDDAPATAPEREIRRITGYVSATGTFTVDAFSADVEADDSFCIFHESILSIEILGYGTLDTSSLTVPADSARPGLYAWEEDDWFNGCLLMPTEGACRFQPRRIVDYTDATGVFTLDPDNPFVALPGAVDYVIIGDACGWAWPYIEGTLTYMDGPEPGQADIEICRLSLHNLRVDGGLIPVADFTGTPLIDIERYRFGADAGWTASPIAGAAMAESPGFANYTYTWPAAFWQVADFFRITVRGIIVTSPAGSVQTIYIPPQTVYGVVGGLSNIKKKVNLIFDIVNAILKLTETGGTVTTDGTEQTIFINDAPMGVHEPRKVKIDCSNMAWGDAVILRWYERIEDGGELVQKDELRLEDVQDADLGKPPIKNIELEPNRYGVQVTIERVDGTDRAYAWEVFVEV